MRGARSVGVLAVAEVPIVRVGGLPPETPDRNDTGMGALPKSNRPRSRLSAPGGTAPNRAVQERRPVPRVRRGPPPNRR